MNIRKLLQKFFLNFNAIFSTFGDSLLKIIKRPGYKKDENLRLLILRIICELVLDSSVFNVLYTGRVNNPPRDPELLFKMLVAKEVLGIRSDWRLISTIRDSQEIREILGLSENETVPCRATLSRFRSKFREHYRKTHENLWEKIINSLIQAFQFTTTELNHNVVFRIDSTMIDSLIREHKRIELFYTTFGAFVNDLRRMKLSIPQELQHYLDKTEFNTWFYRKRKDKIDDLLWHCLFQDIETLLNMDRTVASRSRYFEIAMRLIEEQTCLNEHGQRILRDAQEISSDSLQSPFDPEATYRNKNGGHIGYIVNFVEMIVTDDDGEILAKSIVYYQLEPNIYSDIQFLKDFLERYPESEDLHQLVCDGAYYSEETRRLALEKGFELIPTALTGRKTDAFMADFELSEDGTELVTCPEGWSPKRQSYNKANGMIRCSFALDDCQSCPSVDKCQPDLKTRVAVKQVSRKSVDRANIVKRMKTEDYVRLTNIRNGIEAIPSQLKVRYRANEIRHRGVLGTSMDTGLKIFAMALTKLTNSWIEFGLPNLDLDGSIA